MIKYTIAQFNNEFPDDDSCLDYIRDLMYPNGIRCRKCRMLRPHHRIRGRKAYSCANCGTHTYPLAGTIFEKSRTPLKLWLYAIYLMASTRCGISAKQLERELGVAYKTAHRMFKQIRKLMSENLPPFTGTVEIDETWHGGEIRGKGQGYVANKTMLMGAVERGGSVTTSTAKTLTRRKLREFLRAYVSDDAEAIYTDEHPVYGDLATAGRRHESVRHKREEWVRGDVHTNTIEGFWSTLKRGIDGVYHSVSPDYLQNYLDEYGFRYNRRHDKAPMFGSLTA